MFTFNRRIARIIGLVVSMTALGLSSASMVALAGTAWQPFAGSLPRFQVPAAISQDVNQNNSLAEASISFVGGDYKLNMNIHDASTGKQVSGTYQEADDGTLAQFNLDASSLGHTVNLVAWTANWTVVLFLSSTI